MSNTVRAEDVLPPDVLAAVQKYAAGRLLYVPSLATAARVPRDALIIEARARGMTMRAIASEFGLTERRVIQIMARARRQGGASTGARGVA